MIDLLLEQPIALIRSAIQPRVIARLRELHGRIPAAPPFELVLDDGSRHVFGSGVPAFRLLVRDRRGLLALASLDEMTACEAYMAGSLDLEGSMLSLIELRPVLSDRRPALAAWHKYVMPVLVGQVRADRRGIAEHYDEDPDFYLEFLGKYRCYSHGIFEREDEPLDTAIERKLAFALRAVGAEPGQRILDIGAGWGAMTEYAGRRGIRVTSLTISAQSERYVRRLIQEQGLPCDVVKEHLLEYLPGEKFDAIVNLGVTEHLPDYAATVAQYQRLLKPGGKIYLDACSARRKYPFRTFMLRYIFPGNGSPVCLHEYLEEVARTPFELVEVHNDRMSYSLTCRHWAENLERARPVVVQRFGEAWFRRFQIWLWGCVDVFARDVYGAYRIVLQLPAAAASVPFPQPQP